MRIHVLSVRSGLNDYFGIGTHGCLLVRLAILRCLHKAGHQQHDCQQADSDDLFHIHYLLSKTGSVSNQQRITIDILRATYCVVAESGEFTSMFLLQHNRGLLLVVCHFAQFSLPWKIADLLGYFLRTRENLRSFV